MPKTMVILSAITMMDTGMQLSKQMPLESTRGNLKARLCPLIWLANDQHLPNHMYSFCLIGKNIPDLRALLYITETVQEEHETTTSLGFKRSGYHICKGRHIHGSAAKTHPGFWSIFEIAVHDITDLLTSVRDHLLKALKLTQDNARLVSIPLQVYIYKIMRKYVSENRFYVLHFPTEKV